MKILIMTTILFSTSIYALQPPVCKILGWHQIHYKKGDVTRQRLEPLELTSENKHKVKWKKWDFGPAGVLHIGYLDKKRKYHGIKMHLKDGETTEIQLTKKILPLREKAIKKELNIRYEFDQKDQGSCIYWF